MENGIPSELSEIIQKSECGFAIIHDGIYTYVNRPWADHLGTVQSEVVGKIMVDTVHPDDRDRLRYWLATVVGDSPLPIPTEYRFVGGREPSLLELTPFLFTDGTEKARAFLAREVGEERRQQARLLLADRMMSIGALAAGVAHEINNPLSYVLGNINFIEEGIEEIAQSITDTQEQELREAIEEAKEGAERVRRIVRDLQSFSRADQDSRAPVMINRTIESAINMAWIEIRHRARLTKDFADLPPVEANEARLGQVFLNLLLNAAHALPEGAADKNAIHVWTEKDEDGHVVVGIRDSGPGIPPEIVNQVFDPFFSTKPTGVGTGLGLSISHSIITEIGGSIKVESKLGYGTTFRVKIPPGKRLRKKPSSGKIVAYQGDVRGRVLLIDDEPLITNALKRALRDHITTVVRSGRRAIEVLSSGEEFDVIFCDLMMPELTGMDVHAWIKKSLPGMEERIVFMTGGIFTPRAQQFLDDIDNPRIDKPFDLDAVREFVNNYVQERRSTGDID